MRLFLFLAAVSLSAQLFAQEVKYENAMSWRGNSIELHAISDRPKHQTCLFLANNDSIKAFLMNEKAAVVLQHAFTRQPGEDLIGGFMRDEKIYFFVNNIRSDQLHNRVFNTKTGEVGEFLVPFDLKKERIIERISCGDHFLYFTVNKKTSELIIYDFYSEDKYSSFSHKFEEDIWKSITSSDLISRQVAVQKVDMEGECSVDIAAWKNKVYWDNDTLYLVLNSKKNITRLYSFDLINKKVDSRLIQHQVVNKVVDNAFWSENSFLFEKKLYYVHTTNDEMSVQVIDMFTGNVLKRYDVKRGEDITFKNTPITQEGSSMSKNSVRELGRTNQLLRKMSNASSIVIPTRNANNEIELSVGSYQRIQTNNGGMFFPVAGGAIGGAMGGAFLYANVGGFARSSWTKSARFRMKVDGNTYEHIPGDMGMTINEKIENQTRDIKIPPEAETLFKMDQQYFHAYYDKKERKLVVVKY